MITGVDINRQQILAAGGDSLEVKQKDIHLGGYAAECRVNARSAGRITHLVIPGGFGVRVDTFLYTGYVVPPYYDHLVAKLIVTGKTRTEGLARMTRALAEFVIEGITTNLPLQLRIVSNPIFRQGVYGTGFIADVLKEGSA
jgi:acetyl-CoA carboxylase biotin carboxylase subunit